MPQYNIKAPDGTTHKVNAPEGATEQDAISYLIGALAPKPAKREVGVGEAFGQGFERGKSRFASTITDTIPALVGGALGFDEYATAQLAEANQKAEALSKSAPAVFDSYKDVDSLGDAVKFVAESAGEQIPNMGLALATALTGGAAAPALLGGRAIASKAVGEVAKKAAAKTVASQAAIGTGAGAFLGSYALNAPEVFQNIYEETGELAAGTALLFGSAAAALDSVLPNTLAKNLSGPLKNGVVQAILKRSGMSTGALRGATTGLVTGVAGEFVTEGAQEGISIAAERFIDDNPEIFGSREWDRIMEASVRGAAAGGAYGTAGGATSGVREKAALTQRLASMKDAKTLREATEARQNVNSAEAGITDQLELTGTLSGLDATQRRLTEAEFERTGTIAEREEAAKNAPFNLTQNKEFTDKPAVGLDAALTEARRLKDRGNTFYESIPSVGAVDSLTAEQKVLVEGVQQDLSERSLLADAAEYARLRGIPFDTSKQRADLSPEEQEVFEIVSRTGYQRRNPSGQPSIASVKPTVESQQKADATQAAAEAKAEQVVVNKAERSAYAEDRGRVAAAKKAVAQANREVAAAKKAEAAALKARSKGTPTQEGLDFTAVVEDPEVTAANARARDAAMRLQATETVSERYENFESSPPSNADAEIEAEYQTLLEQTPDTRQGDLFTGVPKEQTKGPLKGQALNKFINDQGLKANAATKDIFAGKDLAIPEQRAEIIAGLYAAAGKSGSTDLISKYDALARKLGETTTTPDATITKTETDNKQDTMFNKTPAFKGDPLSAGLIELLMQGGSFNAALDMLIPTLKGPAQRLIRKIRSQNLNPTLEVAPTETGTTGYYNPTTNTIRLDLKNGLTQGTFIHEAMHASLAQAINNPNLTVTKELFAFFSDIQSSLSGFYGGGDLQEFTAELLNDQQLIALLKGMKPPKGNQSYFAYIADIIARFFGFRKDQTAYTEALRLVENVLDIAQDVEPTLETKLFNGTPAMGDTAMGTLITQGSELVGKKKEDLRNTISSLANDGGAKSLLSKLISGLRLNDLIRLYGKKIPQLVALRDATLNRQGRIQAGIRRIQKNYRRFKKIAKANPTKLIELGKIASEARRLRFDLVGIHKDFDPSTLSPDMQVKFTALSNRLKNLDKSGDLQAMYKDIVTDYKNDYNELLKFTFEGVKAGKQKDMLIKQFTRDNPIVGYVPFRHPGNYFVKYKDFKTGDMVQEGFVSNLKRKEFVAANQAIMDGPPTFTDKMEDMTFNPNDVPPSSFIAKLMLEVDTQNQRDQIYQVMLSMYPDSSFMQRTRKANELGGESYDLLQGYSETALRFNSKLANLEYAPQMEAAFAAIAKLGAERTDLDNGEIQAVANEIGKRSTFMRNPSYPALTGFLTSAAYNLFLLGSVSAAVVNLSAIVMLGLPKLAAEFSFAGANTAMLKAMKTAAGRGENSWALNPRYKTLVTTLDKFGQREHTLQKELQDGARATVTDFESKGAKFLDMLSYPFTAAEKYSRATVAITAYELSLASGKTEQEASDYAQQVVMDVHTTGIAAEGPRLAQHPIGRVMFTFKSWIWNSAVQTAFAANDSVKGADPETKRKARAEIIGIYGMSATVAGVNGLPFFGAAATFANIIAALIPDDEDEPFNARAWTREFVGDFAFKGPVNAATNLEISDRTGIANGLLFREDPYSIEQNGYVLTAIMQAMGPVGSYALGIERGAGKLLAAGEYSRFAETVLPSAGRNVLKAGRYYFEGARTIDGAPIDTDINGYNLFMQAFGFTPADLSNTYGRRADAANYESKVLARKQKILKKYYIGVTSGDIELANEAMGELNTFAQRYPALVKSNTLTSSFKSRQSYEQKLIKGLKFNDALTPELNERFFDDID